MVDEGTAGVGAASVHWRRIGRGPTVVLLHGFPLSGHTWDAVVAQLRDRFTCIMPDLIGLGRSSSGADGDYASEGQARAFQGLLSQLGVDTYALVGNDTGGWIARELALADAGRVSRLVLTNTEIPFHRPPWIPTYQLAARLPGFGTVVRQLLQLDVFRRSPLGFGGCFHDLALLNGPFHERYVEPLIRSAERMAEAQRFLRRMDFSRLDEFAGLHRRLAMPTLFVWGDEDPTFPVDRARAMAGQFPAVAGFREVAAARLFVHEEHPDTVATMVGGFLAE
jgi:pimeloyl-ACP methyl ester carboxylesterase